MIPVQQKKGRWQSDGKVTNKFHIWIGVKNEALQYGASAVLIARGSCRHDWHLAKFSVTLQMEDEYSLSSGPVLMMRCLRTIPSCRAS